MVSSSFIINHSPIFSLNFLFDFSIILIDIKELIITTITPVIEIIVFLKVTSLFPNSYIIATSREIIEIIATVKLIHLLADMTGFLYFLYLSTLIMALIIKQKS